MHASVVKYFFENLADYHKHKDSSNIILLVQNCICTCLFLALILIQILFVKLQYKANLSSFSLSPIFRLFNDGYLRIQSSVLRTGPNVKLLDI